MDQDTDETEHETECPFCEGAGCDECTAADDFSNDIRIADLPPVEVPAGFRVLTKRKSDKKKVFLRDHASFISNGTHPFSGTIEIVHVFARDALFYVRGEDGLEWSVEVSLHRAWALRDMPRPWRFQGLVHSIRVENAPPRRWLRAAR